MKRVVSHVYMYIYVIFHWGSIGICASVMIMGGGGGSRKRFESCFRNAFISIVEG